MASEGSATSRGDSLCKPTFKGSGKAKQFFYEVMGSDSIYPKNGMLSKD